MARRALTECCVGFVFISPATDKYGISATWMKHVLPAPSSHFSWRIASRYGEDSISPATPPISIIAISAPEFSAAVMMRCLISFVTCGTTVIVAP